MNKLEKNIKDAVESYEAPYSAEAWQSLNKAMWPSKATLLKWAASSAALLALVVFGYSYINNSNEVVTDELIVKTIQNKGSKTLVKKVENLAYDTNERHTTEDSSKEITEFNTPSETNVQNEVTKVPVTELPSDVNDNSNKPAPKDENNTIVVDENKTENTNTTVALKAKVITSKTIQCLSSKFNFTPSVSKQNAIYEWHLGDGTIIIGSTIDYTYEVAGHYSVELVLRDLNTKEIIKISPPVEITVLEEPSTSFTYEMANTIEPSTYFRNTTPTTTNLHWEIENLKSSNLENIQYSFKHKGRFTVNLTATNENGCSTTCSKTITIEQDYNLLAPTAFSPNGDNLNDYFMPKALPLMELPFTLTIYDRQGKLMYQTTDSSQPWDGINTQDGIPAENGIYVWVCQLTKENGETEIYQSQIVITK